MRKNRSTYVLFCQHFSKVGQFAPTQALLTMEFRNVGSALVRHGKRFWLTQLAAHSLTQHLLGHHPVHTAFLLPRFHPLGHQPERRFRPTHPNDIPLDGNRERRSESHCQRIAIPDLHPFPQPYADRPSAQRNPLPHPPAATNLLALHPPFRLAGDRYGLPPTRYHSDPHARPFAPRYQYSATLSHSRNWKLSSRIGTISSSKVSGTCSWILLRI